jgi:GxxExxY protein
MKRGCHEPDGACPDSIRRRGRRSPGDGCAITVHRILGPWYRELIYRRAFALELDEQGLRYETEKRILVPYRDHHIDGHRLDFIGERCVVVELKSVPMVKALHRLQVRSYLKATGLRLGFVMNFNEEILTRGLKRVVL